MFYWRVPGTSHRFHTITLQFSMEATTTIGNPNGLISPTIIRTATISNKTMDPFPEDKHLISEHIIILTWFFFTGFLSTAGNAIVLVSSIKYNAIHLDRVSIILIRNLAIADLGFGLSLFSSAMNEAMRWNVFGHRICGIIRIVALFFLYASSCFLASLNLNKLNVLLFPLRSNIRRFKKGYIISCAVWASSTASIVVIVLDMLFSHDDSFIPAYGFNEETFLCYFYLVHKYQRLISIFITICFTFIPMVCVVITTIWMLFFVKKVSGIQRQTIFTLLVVSVTFFVSLAPTVVLSSITSRTLISRDEVELGLGTIKTVNILFMISSFSICINCAANPFIYCLTIRSFGAFIKIKLISAKNKLLILLLRRRRIRIADLAARVARRG